MTTADTLLADLAASANITIEYAPLRPGRDGEYDHPSRTIRLRPGMHARLHRCVLAHELGHAAFADVPSRFGPVAAKQERRAEEWGALRLISVDAYREAEALCNGHAGAMAVELGVMLSTLRAYQGLLSRLGQATYLQPRHGAAQWAHKEIA